jgi:hypothetical protein
MGIDSDEPVGMLHQDYFAIAWNRSHVTNPSVSRGSNRRPLFGLNAYAVVLDSASHAVFGNDFSIHWPRKASSEVLHAQFLGQWLLTYCNGSLLGRARNENLGAGLNRIWRSQVIYLSEVLEVNVIGFGNVGQAFIAFHVMIDACDGIIRL